MSDTPLPDATPEERARLAARLSLAPDLSVPAGGTISGVIELAAGLEPLTADSDVLFVIGREPGDDGPPAAVQRLSGNAYPMPFTLSAPAGEPRPLQLLVKVDKDGDAGTTVGEDLLGFTPDPVSPGDAGVRLLVAATFAELAAETGDTIGGRDGPRRAGPPGVAVEGTLELGEGLTDRTRPDDTVFVVARNPARPGPPVAVLRLTGNRYPMEFRLDDGSLMRGGEWPERVTLEARRDADGDPLTRGTDDLVARLDAPIEPGAAGEVRLRLEAAP